MTRNNALRWKRRAQPKPRPRLSGADSSATEDSQVTALPRAPEEWMRAEYPEVFRFPEERVFVERDGELAGWGSEFVVARILSRDGSPDRPVVFCPEEEEFYEYVAASGLYAGIDTAQVHGRVVELLEACAEGTTSARRGEVLNLRTAPVLSRVPGALKSEARVSVAEFEPTAGVIAVENGLLDLATGQLRDYTPFRPVRTKLPIHWDPNAPEPTRFLEYRKGMLPDVADQSLLMDGLAMALLGNPFQRILLLLGAGGAGKTTLIKLLTGLVGVGDTGEFRPEYAGDKFERCAWIGKRLLYLPERRTTPS